MVHVRRRLKRQTPFKCDCSVADPWPHQHRRHAKRMGSLQIVGDILKHRRCPRVDAAGPDKGVVALGPWLGYVVGADDIEDVLETLQDAELARHLFGVRARSVGEYQLASGE